MSGEKATLTHDRPHAVVSFDGKDTVSIGRRQYRERRSRIGSTSGQTFSHKAGMFPALQGLFYRD
jgi:hypothetical protein